MVMLLRCNKTHVYECNPNAPTQPKPSIPPSPTKPPTKPQSMPPQSLSPSICSDMTADIIAGCVVAAAPFALETFGGSEAVCGVVAYLVTEAVAASVTDPAFNNIC
ncbi:41603_t:CDS:2 [Gigaspora margarita]|uniref:41603_t:CDS:1 n=1 Tax=Gigaspora margarita TaxID=4874 RepID=A0ABN7VC34_GIGMA|nr:41603_t:CDS:2 [Gigaspora margarita]